MNKIKPLWRRRSHNSFRICNFILVQWATTCLCTFLISGSTCVSNILRLCALKLSPWRLSSSVVFSIFCCALCSDFAIITWVCGRSLRDRRPFAVYSPLLHTTQLLSSPPTQWTLELYEQRGCLSFSRIHSFVVRFFTTRKLTMAS